MSKHVRVRFAPSPTGMLHVGSVRSALFNYLWARHNDGVFVLRVEDTDRARLVDGAEAQINESLTALGITPDEGVIQGGGFGPYRQSDRLAIYRQHADILLAAGDLYPCWCSAERLTELRQAAQAAGKAFKYDRYCLVAEHRKPLSEPHVLRFRISDRTEPVTWVDAVRGPLSFETADLDDFVAMKSDGYPTYQFANVIDDHLMEISHVLRADEWIPSTPKHLLVFDAFDWERPIYAHLPAVQGPTGNKKLSKRDGAQSVGEYIEEGYLPEALMSFLASLGWNDGTTQEVYQPAELIARFTLERIQKSPARFDRERLTWINGYMIRHLSLDDLLMRSRHFWPAHAAVYDDQYLRAVLHLVQERLKFLSELPELTAFFFTAPTISEVRANMPLKRVEPEQIKTWLKAAYDALVELPQESALSHEELELLFRQGIAKGQLQLDQPGPFFMCIRVAMTGRTVSPGLFETMSVLGPAESIKRLSQAINFLKVD